MAGIRRIEYYLPEQVVTNDDLAEVFETWSAEKIYKKTGITSRHIAAENETALDLAEKACVKIFNDGAIDKEEIDFLVFVTQNPDYRLPTTACLLQDRLGLRKGIGAFDINLGCSGFIYGLAVAKSLVDAKLASNVLLVTSEIYSKYINELDRSTRTIFGDGAAATVVGIDGIQIGPFDFGTDGSGEDAFKIPASGARIPQTEETSKVLEDNGNWRSQEQIFMDGTEIFSFTLREVPESVNRVLEKAGLKLEEVDQFIFHQANQFMLNHLRHVIGIDKEKFYINMADTGNTVSASIPIALKRALDEKVIEENQTVLLSGFGVGLSWGTVILKT